MDMDTGTDTDTGMDMQYAIYENVTRVNTHAAKMCELRAFASR